MSTSGQRNPAPSQLGSDTPRRPGQHDDNVKVNKPDVFKGDRNNLDDWLIQMELYFAFNSVPEDKKTLFASTFMRDRAQHWFKPYLRKFMESKEDEDKYFTKFEFFKAGIRQIFGVSNEIQSAERIIQHLNQRTSASDYAARFQEYANLIEWDDQALMTMYRRGLKENVKDELMRDGQDYGSLAELIEITIRLDDKLYERAMEKRFDGEPKGRAGSYHPKGPSGSYRTKGSNYSNSSSYPGTTPMELDSTERRKGRNPRGRQGGKQQSKLCYGCGKPGHFARDCRSKDTVSRRQINVLRRIPEKQTQEETDSSSDTLESGSEEDDWFMVHDEHELQQVLEGTAPGKAPATTEEVNRTIQTLRERPRTPYPPVGEKSQSDTEWEWDNELTHGIEKLLNNIDTDQQDRVTDRLEKELGNDATKEMPIPSLQREDAIVGQIPNRVTYDLGYQPPVWELKGTTMYQRHAKVSWTACYEDNCTIHQLDKDGADWYPREPRRGMFTAAQSSRNQRHSPYARDQSQRQARNSSGKGETSW